MTATADLNENLARWYDIFSRDLPWRRDARDPAHGPYRVWVSEIMLQQTQVVTVIPYYQRWIARWPTLEALAAAQEQEVLAAWAGLGYYARCRNLLKAAREVVAQHGGEVPRDEAALLALPGIGRYTAGAIRSIAFGISAPVVDGNVARVLCRLDRRVGDPARPPLEGALWARAEALVAQASDPSIHNQALMELGATVCTPAAPACPLCPLSLWCEGARAGDPSALPTPRKRPTRRQEAGAALVATRGGALWLGQRPREGLLGGTWEPPRVTLDHRSARPMGQVRHVFTHIELTLHVLRDEGATDPVPAPEVPYEALEWVPLDELLTRPLSALARKVLRQAGILSEGGAIVSET